MTAFRYQTIDCDSCNEGWVEEACQVSNYERFGGTRSVRCEECSGTGDQVRLCEGCDEEAALNDEGLCVECAGEYLTEVRPDPLRSIAP
jgi:RecJ-like exonuclease